MEPEIVIIQAWKIDLEQAESQQAELRKAADSAESEAALSEVRKKQDWNQKTIDRLKQSITAKEAELQPLREALYTHTERERREKEEREDESVVHIVRGLFRPR